MAQYESPTMPATEPAPGVVGTAHLVYALHSLSILIGIATAATIVGAFVFGLPSIVAVIINYVKRADARGTWVESHFRWQIRTFWWGLLWGVIGGILLLVLIGYLVLAANAVWIIYRIVKGWLRLSENRAVS